MEINIANNSLSGQIPSSLGSIPSLYSLDLSRNKLSGRIPQSFSSFARDPLLDLSYNRLTGPIPQALTYLADYGNFAGNAGLCLLDISAGVPSCENPYISPLLIHIQCLPFKIVILSFLCYWTE
ncbi:putative leucine-rich repeat receptor-like protein kinase IMK3 [Morella rubra]|uniref:Putative leucine-rich repeat receptor-like protein kinase IMK3 n=1 Tax=Morella rubra TaxID=262757 RepID=A0A6A1WD87_9ROSI|nr:putative leucine-rich repeat receptor-like protein kinase IMK3 [Morella rubra]